MNNRQKQCLLAYLGYYHGNPDGIWGELSVSATRAFQRDYGLTADGIFGTATENRIREVIASGSETVSAGGDFWARIRYWRREEFRCPCGKCGGFPVEPEQTLVELADDVRAHFGRPGHGSSGVRCPRHNAEVGGVANSRHLSGKALDFCIEGVSGEQLLAYVKQDKRTNYAYVISGGPYVHMDVR